MFLRTLFVCFAWLVPFDAYSQTPVETLPPSKEMIQNQRDISNHVRRAKSIEEQIAKVDEVLIGLTKNISALSGEASELSEKEGKLREKLKKEIEAFNYTALTIARLERLPLEALSAASSLRLAHMRKGVVENGRKSLILELEKSREDVHQVQDIYAEKAQKLAEIDTLKRTAETEKQRLVTLFERQVKALELTDKQRAKVLENSRKMQEAQTLKALLDVTQNTEIYLPEFQVKSVSSAWPVKGQIVRAYRQRNETGIPSEGVTLQTTAAEEVLAIKDGRVIYSDKFRNYGHIVILEHADGSNSLYSGLENSAKKLGEFVPNQGLIGLMPNTEKPELYLEIRKGGKTLNPSVYLAEK